MKLISGMSGCSVIRDPEPENAGVGQGIPGSELLCYDTLPDRHDGPHCARYMISGCRPGAWAASLKRGLTMRHSILLASGWLLAPGCAPIDDVVEEPPRPSFDTPVSIAAMVAPDFFAPGDPIMVKLDLSGPPPLAAHTGMSCRDAAGNPKPTSDLTIGAGIIPLNDDGTDNPAWKSKAAYYGIKYEPIRPTERRTYEFGPITAELRKTDLTYFSKVKVVTLSTGFSVLYAQDLSCVEKVNERPIRERLYEFSCGRGGQGDYSQRCGYRAVTEP